MSYRLLAILLVASPLLGACGEPPATPLVPDTPNESPSPTAPATTVDESWRAEVAFAAETKLGGCAVGDLDPSRPGDEVVVVGQDGGVHLIGRDEDRWVAQRIASWTGELIQVAIGDARADVEGLEIVAVGMARGSEDSGGQGAVLVLSRRAESWLAEPVKLSLFPALVHGVAVADIDPGHAGSEIVAVGFDHKATVLAFYAEDRTWRDLVQIELGSPGKNAVGYEGGAAVACAGGTVMWVDYETEHRTWAVKDLLSGVPGQARIATDGERLLVAGDDGKLRLLTGDAGSGAARRVEVLHEESRKLRGAVLADLLPEAAGREAATTGYGGRVTVLEIANRPVKAHVIYDDGQSLHHLAVGDVRADLPGPELVTCGFGGRVVVLARAPR